MKRIKRFKFVGGRVIKTGLAVFITAWLCQLLNLPIPFAVIAAIVTIEHTVADSLRKAIVRFPASAIGAFLAVLFVALFSESPITYALAATITIFICYKLKFNDGILVATLTAVAMIPTLSGDYTLDFISRLATTSIGITVSTCINFIIMPPNYFFDIKQSVKSLYIETAKVLEKTSDNILLNKNKPMVLYQNLMNDLERTFQLCSFQLDEWKYHRHEIGEIREFHHLQKQLTLLQQILYHLGNLQFVKLNNLERDTDIIKITNAIKSICTILIDENHSIPKEHYDLIKELDHIFWNIKQTEKTVPNYQHHFDSKTVIFYETLALHDCLEELEQLIHRNDKHIM